MNEAIGKPRAVHATAVAVGEAGVLIRGPSGAGKSRLAQALIAEATRRGLFARLVGDDRIRIAVTNRRVVARPHPAVAGLIEERGAGLLDVVHEPAARIVCVIDVASPRGGGGAAPRAPEAADATDESTGAVLPRLALAASVGPEEGARRVLGLLERINL
jgi:HPr kinase/phosphorylase